MRNILLGILSGLLFGLVASIPYLFLVIVLQRAFFYLGFLIGFAVLKGFLKFNEELNVSTLIIAVIITIFAAFLIELTVTIYYLMEMFEGANLFEVIKYVFTSISNDLSLIYEIVKDGILTIFLSLVGLGAGYYSYVNEHKNKALEI